ncbi:uncharacterized protein LOC127252340 [Andrographis paniculata]|uniref:uncharacterized protein LOC127252340 n=1 Tax=Andrographis paniculata TaxID=175694 RepID=UPI0021E9A115|nr:uncharacterized protein LOC127252340 [Andrographis paniculata]
MSDRERARVDNGRIDEEIGENVDAEEEKRHGLGEKGRKGQKSNFFRLKRGKKLLERSRRPKQKGIPAKSRSLWIGCCFCPKPPRKAESAGDSPTSDPNSPEFTYDMLRTLIEKNNFYSRDCNPHLDAAAADD